MGLVNSQPSFEVSIRPVDKNQTQEVKYRPNVLSTAGIQVSAFGFTLAYLEDGVAAKGTEAQLGKTDYHAYRLGTFLGAQNQYYINGYYNIYKGFYVENSESVDSSVSASDPRIQHPDMRVENMGGTVMYIFSPDKYSAAAAFSQSAQQTESGGSWVARLALDKVSFSDSQEIIPSAVRNSYGVDKNLKSANYLSLGALGGYGHTFLKNNFFLTAQVLTGLGGEQGNFKTTDGGSNSRSKLIALYNLWLSFGYNGADIFSVLGFAIDGTGYRTDSITLTTQQISGGAILGYRF